MAKSDLEQRFLAILDAESQAIGMQMRWPEREFRFCERRWRFDFAWPSHWVAVEIDGGIFVGGRHGNPLGGHGDRDKLNRAAVLGWKVLRYDAKHLRDNPHGVFEELMQALGAFSEEEQNP